jgi:hypothetical protein
MRLNGARFLLIQVRERFFQGFPLELDLLKYRLKDVHLLNLVLKKAIGDFLVSFLHE